MFTIAGSLARWQAGFDKCVNDFKLHPSEAGLKKLSVHLKQLGGLSNGASPADKIAVLKVYASSKHDFALLKDALSKGGDVHDKLNNLHQNVDKKINHILSDIDALKDGVAAKLGALKGNKGNKGHISIKCKLAAVFGKSLPGCAAPGPTPAPAPPGGFSPPPPPGAY